MEDLSRLFESFTSLKAGVIGDVMLDTYIWGRVERISPEAPVPVVTLDHRDYRVGGAGNVALNCRALGSQVFVLSVTGQDAEAALLDELFSSNSIENDYLVKSPGRITTNKTRIISRNQQMMRLDAEMETDLEREEEQELLKSVERFIEREDPDVIIFEDYNKGVLTENVIREVISLCRGSGILTAVDPKRRNFFSYRGVDLFKPNLKEVRDAFNLLGSGASLEDMDEVHHKLHKQLQHRFSLITLSEKGIYYREGKQGAIIPSHMRQIADVSGAGDTVVAVAALAYASSGNAHMSAEIANIAGGLVCEEVGTAAIEREKLQHECELLLS